MTCHSYVRIVLGSCCIVLLTATGMLSLATAAQPSSDPAVASTRNPTSQVCFDSVFYGPLPGKANYCQGLRDWNDGHYHNGMELLKLAAGWGNKNAQYTLGLIYYGGHHVAPDPALGMAWLKLADERHNDPQIALAMRSAAKWATHKQLERSDQLYRQMLPKYGDAVATARAWRRLQHWRRSHDSGNAGCLYVVGQQAHAALAAGLAEVIFDPSNPDMKTFRVCMRLQTRRAVVRNQVDHYFRDWLGTVTVGPLKTVPAPATSSGH